jgi:pyruvate/2-oxoacid:ferredoxin oxidoreductase beta subunit
MILVQVSGDGWDLALDFQQLDHIFNLQIVI